MTLILPPALRQASCIFHCSNASHAFAWKIRHDPANIGLFMFLNRCDVALVSSTPLSPRCSTAPPLTSLRLGTALRTAPGAALVRGALEEQPPGVVETFGVRHGMMQTRDQTLTCPIDNKYQRRPQTV